MTTTNSSTVAIYSGNFTSNGNFSGYDATGTRIHVPGRLIESLGYNKDNVATIQFPLYAVVASREFNVLGEDQKPTGEVFNRLQAGSLFKTEDSLIQAVNAYAKLTLKAQSELVKTAKSLELTDEVLKELITAAPL